MECNYPVASIKNQVASFLWLDVQFKQCFIHVKWCLRKIQIKMINLQNNMAVMVTKKVKYAMALYHKINVTRSTFYMKSFMLFSKSAQFLDYAALLLSLCLYDRFAT